MFNKITYDCANKYVNYIIKSAKYPGDKPYLANLAKHIGADEFNLSSVSGPEEVKSLLKNSSFSDFYIGEKLEGLINKTFKINLHNHTTTSDGTLSPKQMLEQTKKWADKVFKSKEDKGFFHLAITDHDTLEGSKEAIRLIAENPKEFQNVRFVPGIEIGLTFAEKQHVGKPIDFEMIGYAVNPFDKKMNEFFAKIRESRVKTSKFVIQKMNEEIPGLNLNWEEAKKFHPNIEKGTSDGSLWLVERYAQLKLAANEYSRLQNNKISSSELVQNYYKKAANNELPQGGIKEYFRQLKISGLRQIENFTPDDSRQEHLSRIRDRYVKDYDFLFSQGNIITPKQFFDEVKQSQMGGFYGAAHPGFLDIGSKFSNDVNEFCNKNPWCDKGQHVVWRLFNRLKEEGGELFSAYEAHYQSYDKSQGRKDWVKKVNEIGEGFGLLKAGGIDSHGNTIFEKSGIMSKEKLKEILS